MIDLTLRARPRTPSRAVKTRRKIIKQHVNKIYNFTKMVHRRERVSQNLAKEATATSTS